MPSNKLILKFGAVLFGTLILLGEAFKINLGFAKISLTFIVFACTVAIAINRNLKIHIGRLDKLVYLYGTIFLFYTIVGIVSGNAIGDIFEDLYPIIVFVAAFIIWRSLTIAELNKLWRIIIFFGTLATFKVILISILPFEIEWDNNWQANKQPLPLVSYYRIILRGGDIFLSLALVYYIIDVHRKIKSNLIRNFIFILLTIISVFISLSRSSFLADGLALIMVFLLFKEYFSTKKLAILSVALVGAVIILLPFFNIISLATSIFDARKEAFDANDIATEFRKDERSLILGKASSVYYMGNGLGSYIYQDLSGSNKKDDRSIYAHDFNTWLIFKTGITGLVLFYLIFLGSCYKLFWCLRQKDHVLNNKYQLLLLSLFAGGIVIYIISFLANKLSTLSGCLFFSFFVASSVILKKEYESSV